MNGRFYADESEEPIYTEVIDLDLLQVEPCVAGPKRPQDLVPLSEVVKGIFTKAITNVEGHEGYGLDKKEWDKHIPTTHPNGQPSILNTGSIVLAAITSCTNTSNSTVMIGAGL